MIKYITTIAMTLMLIGVGLMIGTVIFMFVWSRGGLQFDSVPVIFWAGVALCFLGICVDKIKLEERIKNDL